ncbi:alpha/beta fold hydrolase [Paenibacillus senegalensis]|uniref:alpha/beta fold hydrolase n=1 Tax=Paenibacillus senegalensis TaxID=1465766 RepID=UPI00028895BE|nr:alpha/beta hydrolase [Paenibacillus senegalensis]
MQTIKCKDNTTIAYEVSGSGPALILVAAALASHHDAAGLANHLSAHFTVYNYDRRGRGQSSDTLPYAVDREIGDIEALIDHAGGKASLFGSSSGAVLALEAASKLGSKVDRLFLFEPPFVTNNSRPPVPAEYVARLNELIAADRRSDAVEYFMTAAVGVPAEFVGYMKADASWKSMEQMAHTLPYDGTIMGSTQSGKPLPANRSQVEAPTLIMTGENSESFLHVAAQELSELLENAKSLTLSGLDHSAVFAAPDAIANAIIEHIQNA